MPNTYSCITLTSTRDPFKQKKRVASYRVVFLRFNVDACTIMMILKQFARVRAPMANSRKRARKTSIATRDARKRLKVECDDKRVASALVEHPTLCLYYHRVMTLRDYLLVSLPPTSRTRRRKITSIGRNERHITRDTRKSDPSLQARFPNQSILEEERCLATLLDYTLVCAVRDKSPILKEPLERDFASFSQEANPSTGSSNNVGTTTISEV